jgi:sugar phosphate isomerase/epimerase
MQSLLFGTTGLNLFGDAEVQSSMLAHLRAVSRIAEGLGAERLVFGSPRNRDRSGLDDDTALELAVVFFRRLGGIAADHGVCICLEPNPERYGANFMTTARETAAVVRRVNHPAVGLQLDLGAMTLTGEGTLEHLREHADLVRHVHASEPDLVPLGDGTTPHQENARIIEALLREHVVTIEMVATQQEPHLSSIARALDVALQSYGSNDLGSAG